MPESNAAFEAMIQGLDGSEGQDTAVTPDDVKKVGMPAKIKGLAGIEEGTM